MIQTIYWLFGRWGHNPSTEGVALLLLPPWALAVGLVAWFLTRRPAINAVRVSAACVGPFALALAIKPDLLVKVLLPRVGTEPPQGIATSLTWIAVLSLASLLCTTLTVRTPRDRPQPR
jgi:hypothetical protein